jgi:hypothetical protein
MALTPTGATLTRAHTTAQSALQRRIQADLLTIWPLLDSADIDGTSPRFIRAATAILAARRRESAAVAAAYYRAFRLAEGVTGPLQVALMADLAREQSETVLRVVAPVTFKVARRAGSTEGDALRKALVATLGAGSRLVAQGGRETIIQTSQRDKAAFGVARVTRGGSCAFCAMLASRGPVYKTETATFRSHDHCNCGSEVVFSDGDDYDWPGGEAQKALGELYRKATKDLAPGDSLANAFRRAYERPALQA